MSALLERKKVIMNEVLLEVSFNNGALKIKNVPHKKHITPTFDGDDYVEYTMRGSVSLKLSAITEYMKNKNLSTFDYSDYDKYPGIEEILTNYMD